MTILQNERLGSIVFSPGGVAAAKLAPGPRAADFFLRALLLCALRPGVVNAMLTTAKQGGRNDFQQATAETSYPHACKMPFSELAE